MVKVSATVVALALWLRNAWLGGEASERGTIGLLSECGACLVR